MRLFKIGPVYYYLRKPDPVEVVMDTINGIPCDINYVFRGEVVGFWAYGYYHPDCPWQGKWVGPFGRLRQRIQMRLPDRIQGKYLYS